jgi:hypothetical protein
MDGQLLYRPNFPRQLGPVVIMLLISMIQQEMGVWTGMTRMLLRVLWKYIQNLVLWIAGLCPLCSSDFVNRVPDGLFDEQGGVNTVTLVYATSDSDNRGDWTLADITVRQTIPASQPAAGEYEIPLLLSITAN